MMPAMERVSGGNVVPITPQTVAEDFAVYQQAIPGLYVFLGSLPEGVDPAGAPTNHSPYFNIHEPDMELGVRLFAHMVADYLLDE
jgi:metal-dependent amidase/aminoacylase/carboxypeptidase family protein